LAHLASTLTVVDVSGSIYGGSYGKTTTRPITVAVTLGLLVTQVNPNPALKNLVLTFSENPSFHQVKGDTLHDRVKSLCQASWGYSTNCEATFRLILEKAIASELKQSDMPKTLLVISDML
jgi:hypothetical protein